MLCFSMSAGGATGGRRSPEVVGRRQFLSLGAAVLGVAGLGRARAEGWEGAAGGYNELGVYDGSAAPEGEESIAYQEFLVLLDKKEVKRVDFYGPNGDAAYALVGDRTIRLGAGFPEERSKGWSSPLWVARILDNYKVPFKFHFLDGMKFETSRSRGLDSGCQGDNPFLCMPNK